jgi:hypothetical protein
MGKLTYTLTLPAVRDGTRFVHSSSFDHYPNSSCTIAHRAAAIAWYDLQSRLAEPQEGSLSEKK